MIALHGRTIRAESGGNGRGSTFRFVIPLRASFGAADAGAQRQPDVKESPSCSRNLAAARRQFVAMRTSRYNRTLR
jgi:hypothetical protein